MRSHVLDRVQVHPVLEAVLDFPRDPLTAFDLAGILGTDRNTVCEAMRRGVIPSTGLALRKTCHADGKFARRMATKSNIIEWLWRSQAGGRVMMRTVLENRAPHILKVLEAMEAAAALPPPAAGKIIQHPSAARKASAPQTALNEHPELKLFSA